MVWEYRVIKDSHESEDDFYIYYSIREVYYNKKNEINGWSSNSIEPMGETLEELKSDLDHMVKALNKPVLMIQEDKLVEEE